MSPKDSWRIVIGGFGIAILAWGLVGVVVNHPSTLLGSPDVADVIIRIAILLIAFLANRKRR